MSTSMTGTASKTDPNFKPVLWTPGGGGVTVIPAAELFNAANSGTVLQRYQRVGRYRASTGAFAQNSFFNQILEVQSPRIVRLGLQVNF